MALPTITLTNTTLADITLTQLAVTVPASSSLVVGQQTGGFDRPEEILNDEELQVHLASGDITAEFANTDLAQGAMTAAQSLANVQAITALAIKHSLHETSAPTVTDDEEAGYSIGSTWVDTSLPSAWKCVDATAGAAVWIRTTARPANVFVGAGPAISGASGTVATLSPLPVDKDEVGLYGNTVRYPRINDLGEKFWDVDLVTGIVTWFPASAGAGNAGYDTDAEDRWEITWIGF